MAKFLVSGCHTVWESYLKFEINMGGNKRYQAKQMIIANRHLKEWKNNIALEAKILYELRYKHKSERNLYLIEGIYDVNKLAEMVARQKREIEEMNQSNSEKRLDIQARHHREKNQL